MWVRTDDILAGSLIFLSIVIFYLSLDITNMFIKIISIISAIGLLISEGVFLFQKIRQHG